MNSLFLFQFACFIFMLINAFIVAVSALHVRWRNKRYKRSRWMIVAALIGLAIQYVVQMSFGFRATDDSLGAVINILIYTPCISLIAMSVYHIETTRANSRKMNIMCGVIYAAILLVFGVSVNLHHSLFIKEGLYVMLALFCVSVAYCTTMILREMSRRKKMLETMSATDMLPYVRYRQPLGLVAQTCQQPLEHIALASPIRRNNQGRHTDHFRRKRCCESTYQMPLRVWSRPAGWLPAQPSLEYWLLFRTDTPYGQTYRRYA